MSVITIIDESLSGEVLYESVLTIKSSSISVKELIESRVSSEVKTYNDDVEKKFYGLIQPTKEIKLNESLKKKKTKGLVDAEKQIYVALDAFQKNGFFILIDEVQAESLDQKIEISETTRISFVKLTPLVGG